MKRSLLFCAFVSFALAQQSDYGGSYGEESYQGDDNLYANYAARQHDKAVGAGGRGWPKLLMAGVGGYILGAKIHTGRLKKSVPKLRFRVRQQVECNMGSTGARTKWVKGTIAKLWPQQTEGQWVPYQVRLDDGRMIFAPLDSDVTIRAAK